MRQLEDNSSDALIVLTALEALARLAWNDDEVREGVAQMEGRPFCLPHTHTCIEHCIKSHPRRWLGHSGCLYCIYLHYPLHWQIGRLAL